MMNLVFSIFAHSNIVPLSIAYGLGVYIPRTPSPGHMQAVFMKSTPLTTSL